ncbi:hypothetical protein [Streptomyces sp. NPDC051452]|uniref:hypothetical protein n=1 Tax=Streptomyces sp. NPDC051452 TaxID=3365654 RepID=UPI0037BA84F9
MNQEPMRRGLLTSALRQVPSILLQAGVAVGLWAAWLGVRSDGSTTGPYAAWQVAGLVVTLAVPVCWAAFRRCFAGAVLGTTAGLSTAAWADWSDDSTGLFAIGVGLVTLGSLAATLLVSALVHAVACLRGPDA